MTTEKKQGGKAIRNANDLELMKEILDGHPNTKLKVMDVIRKTLGLDESGQRIKKSGKPENN
jgi:hypothetical protein